jgi:hypothetical protein
LEQTIQNHHPSTKAPVTTATTNITRGQWTGQPLQKKQCTTNTTDSNANRNSNGNSSGTTAKTLPDLRNLSCKELKQRKSMITSPMCFCLPENLPKMHPQKKSSKRKIVKQHNQVIIHYQEEIGSKIFAGIQNGKTNTMEV